MNVKAFATYTAVFVAGAVALFGLNALSGNNRAIEPSVQNSAPAVNMELATPDAQSTPAENSVATSAPVDTATAEPITSGAVTPIGDLQRNTFVSVHGTVERVTDEDEFLIVDESGSVRVWTANTFFAVEPGESVVVEGFVDDDVFLEIYAQEITRADGTVVTIGSYSG